LALLKGVQRNLMIPVPLSSRYLESPIRNSCWSYQIYREELFAICFKAPWMQTWFSFLF